jgi:ABC transporter substrate binding protein
MSNKSNATIATMGVNIGKNSFHVVGLDLRGAIVLRQKWSRGQWEARLANIPRCLIAMEACVGAHHLSRKLQSLGHDTRLMPARYVRANGVAGLGSVPAWPLMARAQQAAMPVIGFLLPQSTDDYKIEITAFLQGLKETGYVEGQNVVVQYRPAENQLARLPALAVDLVRRGVAVIVAFAGTAAVPAKAATTTIPIVFYMAGDPVALGLVASFNRPGANLTGHVGLSGELMPKRLQLLHELLPNAALFGVLADPASPTVQSQISGLQAAARTLGLQLIAVANARTDSDFETAFATFSRQRLGAVLVGESTGTTRGADGPRCAARDLRIP